MNIQTLKGLRDYWRKKTYDFYPWGFAMNGQTSRLEATRQIIFSLKIERIIETGTFRGTTTEWFGQFGLPVESIENNDRFFAFSKARLSKFENVHIFLDSSVNFLKRKVTTDAALNDICLFYLDSHWENHLPLREELELVFRNYTRAVVLIDDFKVEDDPGYGYDNYGSGKALTLEYVAASSIPELARFFPSTPSREETGARRGWVVLAANEGIAALLRTISLLREYEG
jgi:hypothetical protein